MHNQQYGFADFADCMPALSAIDDAVLASDEVWIRKHSRCDFEGHASVLLLV